MGREGSEQSCRARVVGVVFFKGVWKGSVWGLFKGESSLRVACENACEEMVVVLECWKYVFKGITEWSIKWHCHGWTPPPAATKKMLPTSLRCLFPLILLSCCSSFGGRRTMKVWRNNEADAWAESGRQKHPNNKRRSEEPVHVAQLWEEVGLCPMHSDVLSPAGGTSSGTLSGTVPRSSVCLGGGGGHQWVP